MQVREKGEGSGLFVGVLVETGEDGHDRLRRVTFLCDERADAVELTVAWGDLPDNERIVIKDDVLASHAALWAELRADLERAL